MNYLPPSGDAPRFPEPPRNEPLSGGLIAGLLSLGCFLPIIGPLVGLIYGIARSKQAGAVWLIAGNGVLGCAQLFVLLVMSLSLPNFLTIKEKAREAEVKQNLHSIQLSIERYAVEDPNGLYPKDVSAVIGHGYMNEYPRNPFTNLPMKEIQPGDPDFAGEFSYFPIIVDEVVTGYRLIGYGSSKSPPDRSAQPGYEHMIIELNSGL